MSRKYPIGDIKILWALAGGRCCFPGCSEVCIASASGKDGPAVIGDVAHIVAHSPGGPRADPSFPREELDTYANWILLCAAHHRLVDAQPSSHDAETLRRWKREHENWVADRLGEASVGRPPKGTAIRLKLYRVAVKGVDPWRSFTPARPVGRWDDPAGAFAVRYAAESPKAAIASVAAGAFGVDRHLLRREFMKDHVLAAATIEGTFANIDDAETQRYVEERLVPLFGPRPPHMSTSADWRWSQQASRVLSDAGLDGIIYSSRYLPGQRMFAIFDSAQVLEGESSRGERV